MIWKYFSDSLQRASIVFVLNASILSWILIFWKWPIPPTLPPSLLVREVECFTKPFTDYYRRFNWGSSSYDFLAAIRTPWRGSDGLSSNHSVSPILFFVSFRVTTKRSPAPRFERYLRGELFPLSFRSNHWYFLLNHCCYSALHLQKSHCLCTSYSLRYFWLRLVALSLSSLDLSFC